MKEWNKAAEVGTVSDQLNPAFIMSDIHPDLLVKIANGELNCVEIAKRHLENRGLDISGNWVGFGKDIN